MSKKILNFDFVIDAEDASLGRVAALAAKKALQGHVVAIINCEKSVVTGGRAGIIQRYLVLRRRPHVKFPSNPEMMMKRAIRGMIGYKSGRGEAAFENIRCFRGSVSELSGKELVKLDSKEGVKLKELGRMLKTGK